MSMLFDKTGIKGMASKNRPVRSATREAMADDACFPTDERFKLYAFLPGKRQNPDEYALIIGLTHH